MSTKVTIAGVTTDDLFVHIYIECFDESPEPVYIAMWRHVEETNRIMAVSMPQKEALQLADDLARWASSVRENNARIAQETP